MQFTRRLLQRLGLGGAIAVQTVLAVVTAVALTVVLLKTVRGGVEPELIIIAALVALIIAPALSSYVLRLYFEMEQTEAKLQELVTFDDLTRTYNRRQFFVLAERELARARRDRTPLSLIMIDIDHFKRINDRFGHLQGDKVLREFAAACQSAIRPQDAMARFGGEEFVVLLPDADADQARRVAERLRGVATSVQLPSATNQNAITISAGIAQLQDGGDVEFDALIKAADDALYQAKQGGRDRVCVAEQPPPQSVPPEENGMV